MKLRFFQHRWQRWLAALLLALLAFFIAQQWLFGQLRQRVANALGPRATVESIGLAWNGVVLRGLAVRGEPGRWPASDELRADRVLIQPALSDLWLRRWAIARIDVDGGYLALLRTREGKLVALPSLMAHAAGAASGAAPTAPWQLHIASIALRDVALDLFDASVTRGAPHRLRISDLHADLGPLALPQLDERMAIDVRARFKGPQRDGRLSLAGHVTPATREADLKLDAQGVELTALQPYLLKSGESAIKAGTLDLRLHAKASQQRLQAPGHLVLRGLELQSGGGMLGTFGGVPRQAVLAAMSRDGKIELDFTLEGRVDDPKFSLNEVFASRFAVGLAEKLGITLGGVVEGVGGVIKGLLGR